jgi:hypothetical protein
LKRISRLTVVAIAALAMTAAVGTSSASAYKTGLCDEPSALGCSGSWLPAGSYLTAGAAWGTGSFTLKNIYLTANCEFAAFSARTTAEFGEPLPATSESTVFGCVTQTGTKCTQTVFNKPAATLESTGGYGKGVVRFGTASEPLTLSLICPLTENATLKCTYKATSSVPMESSLTGGPYFAYKNVINEYQMALASNEGTYPCGSGLKMNLDGWNATDTFTAPKFS